MKFGKKNSKKSNLIVESKKTTKKNNKDVKLQDKLLELEDYEIEALYEADRISEEEYNYILDFRKKKKSRKKKSQKEQFEERIRCDNTIIEKIVNLGRKYRIEDLLSKGKFEEARKADINKEFFDEKKEEYFIDARTRDKKKEERLKEKFIDRDKSAKGRGRERDSR